MNLENIAEALVAENKGILAADESLPTIKKRFDSINIESSPETRRDYRELLFTTKGFEKYISGVILFEETLKGTAKDGTPFPAILESKGVIPGIKCDKGLATLPKTNGEKVTQGLDGLQERLEEYYKLGARFSKWRAVITIDQDIPTIQCIEANAFTLARYAGISQSAGLVPIVEPEVLMNGNHDIETCYTVTLKTLDNVFTELRKQGVALEGMLLKPNMVISGLDCPEQASAEKVAGMTVQCFRQVLPPALPGVVFLSGGQRSITATENLNAMNDMYKNLPWELSFSYGRALQEAPLKTWGGISDNMPDAQQKLYHRAKCNGMARSGQYSKEMENS
ncbi:class I fructose-bisphosphate aldolase [Thermodesulfobacteriota bacterium]